MKRQNVLEHKLRRVAMLAVLMAFDVEAYYVPAFREKAICPAPKPAIKIDTQSFRHQQIVA